MIWTSEMDAVLREKASVRCSAKQIGEFIGGKTKNAVISRAKRIGVKLNEGPVKRSSKSVKHKTHARPRISRFGNAVRQPTLPLFPEAPADAPVSLDLTLVQLTDFQCHYIAGDDRLYCGHPVRSGTHWCEFHYRLVYRPVDESKRARSTLCAA